MSAGTSGQPLENSEFATLMTPFGPFEPQPRLAVAVSGGADSLALAILMQAWADAQGGTVVALSVDHGLRRGSAAEAGLAGRTLTPLQIEHRVLKWRGAKPKSNIQAAARRARYQLLQRFCARHGLLHLGLAHHLDDQAETLLLRLARGSGLDGLAAMAAVSELSQLRVLRPLLGIPKARLMATLSARGIDWTEDPSNRDPAYARVQMRGLMPDLARHGLTRERLGATAAHLGRARASLDLITTRLMVRAVTLDPAGFARLDPVALLAAPEEVGRRALARVLVSVGGAEYGPRRDRLNRLYRRIASGDDHAGTLGGCRVLHRAGRLLVVREGRNLPSVPVNPGARLCWDRRFEVVVHRRAGGGRRVLRLGPLGAGGWAEVRNLSPEAQKSRIPAIARTALPALFGGRGVLAVPHLGYQSSDSKGFGLKMCQFRPANSLCLSAFTVA